MFFAARATAAPAQNRGQISNPIYRARQRGIGSNRQYRLYVQTLSPSVPSASPKEVYHRPHTNERREESFTQNRGGSLYNTGSETHRSDTSNQGGVYYEYKWTE